MIDLKQGDLKMNDLTCKHCGGKFAANNLHRQAPACPHCGIPLSPDLGKNPQRKFVLLFIGLIIFCVVMILWLPPDWTRFLER